MHALRRLLDLDGTERSWRALCRVPDDLGTVTDIGEEMPRPDPCLGDAASRVWKAAQALYRTGLHPALQICVRHRGAVVLDRALGYASGGAPGDPEEAPKTRATTDTPFRIYSASKAVTAMAIHKLDEQGALHVNDRVCEYLPEFCGGHRETITIAHVLSHRAGLANPPAEALDLDLLEHPDEMVRLIAEQPLSWRPGRTLAYHAITGGFVLGEVVRRATGQDLRAVLRKQIAEPLGLRWTNYGVEPEDLPKVARDAVTGVPPVPPVAQMFRRALGVGLREAVALAQDPRFLRGLVPSANVVTTARELSAFYQCLLDSGEYGGACVFEPRTVHRATIPQSFFEFDLTLAFPVRYGLGFMLGARWLSVFGPDTEKVFGHLGLTNIFSWADPRRHLAVALLTSGKPVLNPETVQLLRFLLEVGRAFPKD